MLSFCYKGRGVCLQGIKPSGSQCCVVWTEQHINLAGGLNTGQLLALGTLSNTENEIPLSIVQLLREFDHLFVEPQGLPPRRVFDHAIPLMTGVQPVNLRPYRYNPTQKTEIEKQVIEMLAQGIIQPSTSSFSSPVLLVQKKDQTWRFCVNYRHLNVVTIKNRYPLPIIDKLLDELASSQWFTSLDLRTEYHQIRMRPEDEHKTAFKTYHCHFEF